MLKKNALLTTLTLAGVMALYGCQTTSGASLAKPFETGGDKVKEIFGGGTGCALAGIAGYFGGKELGKYLQKKENSGMSAKQVEQFAQGAALAGCAAGASAGVTIVRNLSESAKQARMEAWDVATSSTGPVAWVDPNDSTTRGTTELIDVAVRADGKKCGVRRDIIETAQGNAEPLQDVCQVPATGKWEVELA